MMSKDEIKKIMIDNLTSREIILPPKSDWKIRKRKIEISDSFDKRLFRTCNKIKKTDITKEWIESECNRAFKRCQAELEYSFRISVEEHKNGYIWIRV